VSASPLGLAATIAALVMLLAGCSVGGPVPGAPAHHRQRGFANVDPAYTPAPRWAVAQFFVRRVLSTTFWPRTASLPHVDSDLGLLRANSPQNTVTWVGHSTLLIQLDGVNILTDPQWSDRASPVAFAGPRRVTPPGLPFQDLPPIHLVLISHDHYDHLDVETVLRLHEAHHPRFLVPLGLKAWFAELGISDVEELDWWQSRTERGLTLTCVPAQHFSGRTPWDRNQRLWAGWVVAGRDRRMYFAGDTAYYAGLKEIGERLGPFDLAAIPIGAYQPPVIMRPSHIAPEQALRALEDVRGYTMVAIHWGTFDLAEEPIEEAPGLVQAEAHRLGLGPDRVWILKHGETRRW